MPAPPPVPALPDAARLTTYAPVASTGPFAVGFALYGDATDYTSWVQVFLDGVQQTSGWTLTSASGSLSTLARPITDAQITFTAPITGSLVIVSAQRPRRLAQNDENRGVTARDFNQFVTAFVAMQREVYDLRSRLPLIPPDATSPLLPAKATRALQALGFDASGNFTPISQVPAGVVSAGMADVVAAADHATAYALLSGGGSTPTGLPIGSPLIWPGLVAPSQWAFANGAAVSRATYPEALAVMAPTFNCTIASGNTTITGLADTSGFAPGWAVEGSVIPAGTTIQSVPGANSIVLSQPPTSNGSSIQVFPHGNAGGGGSFNLPNYEDGRALIGLDLAQSHVTGAHLFNATLGEQTHQLVTNEIPKITPAGAVGVTLDSKAANVLMAADGSSFVGSLNVGAGVSQHPIGVQSTSFNGTQFGNDQAHNNVQPSRVARVIVYLGH